ncbi:MAG: hypothetical protein KDA96_25605, partial [Planctomycetaceae bacterium]|nr:hypothetical protein [Planctomycetaceae bacterium]
MANEPNPAADEQPEGSSSLPSAAQESGLGDDDLDTSSPPQGTVDEEDELPEDLPLTAEMVEEEAIRGDFMLRCAVILLAVLLGFGAISSTRILVHIRSGDFMRANGFLPGPEDPFSFATGAVVAEDGGQVAVKAVNPAWLFDHVSSLIYMVGGFAGISLVKGLLAALIAWRLMRISVPGMPTWWNSICVACAVVAISTDFAPLTELVTLLGVTILLSLLHQHRESDGQISTVRFPLLVAIWCNFDTHAWIGPLILLLYAAGARLTDILRRRSELDGETAEPSVSSTGLWLAAVASIAALLINPFPFNSLLSPIATYTVEYAQMAEHLPVTSGTGADGRLDFASMLDTDAIAKFDHTHVAGLVVILLATCVLVISWSRNDLPIALVLGGLFVLSVFALHELPVTSIVAAVAAGTTAQR